MSRTTGRAAGPGGWSSPPRPAAAGRGAAGLARHRLGRRGQPRALPPAARRGGRVAVRDDAPLATPTPSRGSCCRRRATAAPRSRWSSTACRRGRRRGRRAPARDDGPSRAGGPSCSSCPRRPLEDGRLPAAALAPVRGLAGRAGGGRERARRGRPPDADRRAGEPAAARRVGGSGPLARAGGAPPRSATTSTARTPERSKRSTRRCAAVRCCAARSSPAGTRSWAPAT